MFYFIVWHKFMRLKAIWKINIHLTEHICRLTVGLSFTPVRSSLKYVKRVVLLFRMAWRLNIDL